MACEGSGMSDARIGEALIKGLIEEELRDMSSEDVPALTLLAVEHTEQEQKMVTQLINRIHSICDTIRADEELQEAIDGVACSSSSKWDHFKQVAARVIEEGITWERIALFFYVAAKLAVKMVEARLPQSVRDILKWTVEFFTNNLLGWIVDHGGWINSFSELEVASVQSVSSLSSHSYGLIVIFITGLALGSFITWRLTRWH